MSQASTATLDSLWAHHHAEWRSPAQILSQWREADLTNPALLHCRVRGDWWEVLQETGVTLLVTREYEHLVMGLSVSSSGPQVSYLPLPHPSGLVVDRKRRIAFIASTRNPNQIYALRPALGMLQRLDVAHPKPRLDHPLMPVRSWYLPGCLYLHDLALVGGQLYGNAVGHNAVVRLHEDGRFERVWWPRCIEQQGKPQFGRNHLQLNSIASGRRLMDCFFSASTDVISSRRPGHRNFPVDGRGVIFFGKTREPVVRGLTRPHSARLHAGRLWVDNSGYGEVGVVEKGRFVPVTRLPGWTRGLCFCQGVAFVGTSCVIPRFRQYAPGLEVTASVCGVHAVDATSGRVLGSLIWPHGNQIFGLDWMPSVESGGLPFRVGAKRLTRAERDFFYAFEVA